MLGVVKNKDGYQPNSKKYFYIRNPTNPGEGYYIGIIDTLTKFDFVKQCEFVYKSIAEGEGASCKPPKNYQWRFFKFMR